MEFTFVPSDSHAEITVPCFEDARADYAPYYRTRKTIREAQFAVMDELVKLGASGVTFHEGHFMNGQVKRLGFQIRFSYGGGFGLIRAAGLPIRSTETSAKKQTVQVQALLNVRDWLKASVTAQVFSPGSDPLIPFMLVDGSHTVSDFIRQQGQLPQLNPPGQAVIDG